MALQISGTTVVDNSRNLTNIATVDSSVTSIYDRVGVTAVNKTLVNREHVTVTAAGKTITLPASPSGGWEVAISVGNFEDTILARNGQNIMGLAENMTIDKAYVTIHCIFSGNATQGWRIF
jgi:hypothetical protein